MREVDEQTWEATPVTHAMTKPAIEGGHKHLWDMSFGTAAKIPEYMRQFGYRSPTSVLDGPLQYAMQRELTTFEYLSSEPGRLEDFNNMMTGIRHSRPSWMEWYPVRDRLLDGLRKDTALLIDVGCGWGHDVVAFQKKHASTEWLGLQDLAHVLADVRDLPQNIEYIEYNFLEAEQPVKGTCLVRVKNDKETDCVRGSSLLLPLRFS